MKAKLVKVSFMTRVVVEDNATENQILEASKEAFLSKVNNELSENLEEIEDDDEMPYGDGLGESKILTPFHYLIKFTDNEGEKHIAVGEHSGEEDEWYTYYIGNKAFEFNSFGGLTYSDDPNSVRFNVYQYTEKEDGFLSRDNWIVLPTNGNITFQFISLGLLEDFGDIHSLGLTNIWCESSFDSEDVDKEYPEYWVVAVDMGENGTQSVDTFDTKEESEAIVKYYSKYLENTK